MNLSLLEDHCLFLRFLCPDDFILTSHFRAEEKLQQNFDLVYSFWEDDIFDTTSWGWAVPSSFKLEVMVEAVVKVSSWRYNKCWSSTNIPGWWWWLGGLWSNETKLIHISTQVEVVFGVWLDIVLKINFHGWVGGWIKWE